MRMKIILPVPAGLKALSANVPVVVPIDPDSCCAASWNGIAPIAAEGSNVSKHAHRHH
jgi:hypothetical protein